MTHLARVTVLLVAASALLAGCRRDTQSPATGAPAGRGSVVASAPLPPPVAAPSPAVEPRGVAPVGIGGACVVHLRRDALGLNSGTGVVEPTAANIGPRNVAIRGRLLSRDASWVVVEGDGGKRYAIPTSAVLVVESEPAR
ncbi:MAG TPA: hypothetical protein VK324_17860 [Tepidisphaeraceae bacterium]|nr:hypothetical protein [Tepidisphaeraceae bacterium]